MQIQKLKLDSDSVVQATRDQVSSTVGEEEVILHLEHGSYYGLDAVGARIWRLIQEPTSITELVEQLVQEYDVAPNRCNSDLINLLHDLHKNDLLEVHSR